MMAGERFSILSGTYHRRSTRAPTSAPAAEPQAQTLHVEAMAARMRADVAAEVALRVSAERLAADLQAQLARISGQLERQDELAEKAKEDAEDKDEALRTRMATQAQELARARAQADLVPDLRAKLDLVEAELHGSREALAREKALHEGAAAQLAREREANAQLHTRLQQAISASVKAPVKEIPLPSYDMVVVARDPNNRPHSIRLTPRKE